MIESLHSPHVVRVKALIGSKGSQERKATGLFVAEGVQAAREAIGSDHGPQIEILYYTAEGSARIAELNLHNIETLEVSNAVMEAMTSTVTPQGVLSICSIPNNAFEDFTPRNSKPRIIYLHEIQDPGNAGTILRTADACGFDAVITSPKSVDFYSPKVVRSTAGSLWHIPVFQGIDFATVERHFPSSTSLLLSSHASKSVLEFTSQDSFIVILGNEARGVSVADLCATGDIEEVTIPMQGNAESLNLSAAASIVMFTLSSKVAG